jgi:Tol biopolymer transport system component
MTLSTRVRLLATACALSLAGLGGANAAGPVRSVVEVLDVDTGARHEVYRTDKLIEAPNWSRDGKTLVFNGGGRLYRLPVAGGEPVEIPTGKATHANNDHGLSPDGRWIALSDNGEGPSRVHVVPFAGGEPRAVTTQAPSYWHGWSPDGATLAFVGERDGNFDIYSIPAAGGPETRLTTDPAPDDGPDYAPDGTLYINSARSGRMQIWRMKPDGSDQTRVTDDDAYADWFPHPSPDGKSLIFLSFAGDVTGHPPDKDVTLRLMPLDGSAKPRVVARLFGGQGTINVPSWSPDSRHVAFVSYRPLPPGAPPDR